MRTVHKRYCLALSRHGTEIGGPFATDEDRNTWFAENNYYPEVDDLLCLDIDDQGDLVDAYPPYLETEL